MVRDGTGHVKAEDKREICSEKGKRKPASAQSLCGCPGQGEGRHSQVLVNFANLSSTGSSLIRLPPEAVVLICACFRLLASAIRIPLGSEDARPDILIGSAEKEMLSSAVVTACSKPCQVAVATFQSSSSY